MKQHIPGLLVGVLIFLLYISIAAFNLTVAQGLVFIILFKEHSTIMLQNHRVENWLRWIEGEDVKEPKKKESKGG